MEGIWESRKVLVDAEEDWQVLSQEVGETILDVQRTFMDLVDQRALGLFGEPCVDSYQSAVRKLQLANIRLLRHLLLEEDSSTIVVRGFPDS